MKLQTLAKACTPRVKNFQEEWYNRFPWMRRDAIKVWTPVTEIQKLYSQILAFTPKCHSLEIHVPSNENVCGHAAPIITLP